MTDMKGTGITPIGLFVREAFGEAGHSRWLDSLSAEARKTYGSTALAGNWYPVKEHMSDPIRRICDIFYHGDLKGSWESGRFIAEYALKGIYEAFGGSPENLIKNGEIVIAAYYRPSPEVHIESAKGIGTLHISNFPDLDDVVELNIGGWIEHALEMSKCKDVKVQITRSLAKGDSLTEYRATWK